MSDTYKHKGKGYWNNGITSKPEVDIYLKYCRRHNKEKSYFKKRELRLKESIADAAMKKGLKEAGIIQ